MSWILFGTREPPQDKFIREFKAFEQTVVEACDNKSDSIVHRTAAVRFSLEVSEPSGNRQIDLVYDPRVGVHLSTSLMPLDFCGTKHRLKDELLTSFDKFSAEAGVFNFHFPTNLEAAQFIGLDRLVEEKDLTLETLLSFVTLANLRESELKVFYDAAKETKKEKVAFKSQEQVSQSAEMTCLSIEEVAAKVFAFQEIMTKITSDPAIKVTSKSTQVSCTFLPNDPEQPVAADAVPVASVNPPIHMSAWRDLETQVNELRHSITKFPNINGRNWTENYLLWAKKQGGVEFRYKPDQPMNYDVDNYVVSEDPLSLLVKSFHKTCSKVRGSWLTFMQAWEGKHGL